MSIHEIRYDDMDKVISVRCLDGEIEGAVHTGNYPQISYSETLFEEEGAPQGINTRRVRTVTALTPNSVLDTEEIKGPDAETGMPVSIILSQTPYNYGDIVFADLRIGNRAFVWSATEDYNLAKESKREQIGNLVFKVLFRFRNFRI